MRQPAPCHQTFSQTFGRRPVFAAALSALLLWAAAPALAFSPEEAGFDSARLQRIDAYLERMVKEDQVAGVTVMIVRDGIVV